MCGRFTHKYTWPELQSLRNLSTPEAELPPGFWEKIEERRYNVAPSQFVPVIRQGEHDPEPAILKWGIQPHWMVKPGPDRARPGRAGPEGKRALTQASVGCPPMKLRYVVKGTDPYGREVSVEVLAEDEKGAKAIAQELVFKRTTVELAPPRLMGPPKNETSPS